MYDDEMSLNVWRPDMSTDEVKAELAERELDKFLEKHPHLAEKQRKIQELLDKTPAKDRINVLFIMLGAKMI